MSCINEQLLLRSKPLGSTALVKVLRAVQAGRKTGARFAIDTFVNAFCSGIDSASDSRRRQTNPC